jgi:hypothetical protein
MLTLMIEVASAGEWGDSGRCRILVKGVAARQRDDGDRSAVHVSELTCMTAGYGTKVRKRKARLSMQLETLVHR